jgi:hypothetical protein
MDAPWNSNFDEAPKDGTAVNLLQDGEEYWDHEWFEGAWSMVFVDQAGPYVAQRLTHPSHWRPALAALEPAPDLAELVEALRIAGPIALADFANHPFILNEDEKRKVAVISAALAKIKEPQT